MNPEHVTLRAMTEADLTLVRRWLGEPHVARWWGDPANELALIQEDRRNEAMEHFIIEAD
jgi:aminoglycoside 6'-N-acetyltransferase